jgi:tetratricopeptide (TPR) repeat protein
MPFGKKIVGEIEIDFDKIYKEVFSPAISSVDLPEGGKLIPRRTDQDYYSANIDTEMFAYLQYSRFAFVDITGLNPNVFYELGIRHQSNQSGTAIFRQSDKPIPFDISHIKAFPYDFEPVEQAEESRQLIKKVLSSSLEHNRIDSPVQVALATQQLHASADISKLLQEATVAMRNDDFNTAISKYKEAVLLNSRNPILHQELGLLLKGQDRWQEAIAAFTAAKGLLPQYSDAWRELGIAENKLYHKGNDPSLPTGKEALLKAIGLNSNDFDAYASLGGIYKREENYEGAADMYAKSVEVSNGHPYPLLNALLLQVREQGPASITPKQKIFMKRAEVALKKQVNDNPPYNSPWCFFDLSTINLLNNNAEALSTLENMGIVATDWQYKTHYETLTLLKNQKCNIPMLENVISYLEQFTN